MIFHFTFGQAHRNNAGMPMKDYYVTVIAPDWDKARELFMNKFANIELPQPDQWSFQYEDWMLNMAAFPKGEYKRLTYEQ